MLGIRKHGEGFLKAIVLYYESYIDNSKYREYCLIFSINLSNFGIYLMGWESWQKKPFEFAFGLHFLFLEIGVTTFIRDNYECLPNIYDEDKNIC